MINHWLGIIYWGNIPAVSINRFWFIDGNVLNEIQGDIIILNKSK